MIGSKPLLIIFDKIDGFIRISDGTISDGSEKYDTIYYRIRYLVSLKSSMTYIFSYFSARIKVPSLNYLRLEIYALPVYDDRCMKTKIRTKSDKFYTNFHGLNVPKVDIECKVFTVISIDFLLVYKNKYYLQVYLEICGYKI